MDLYEQLFLNLKFIKIAINKFSLYCMSISSFSNLNTWKILTNTLDKCRQAFWCVFQPESLKRNLGKLLIPKLYDIFSRVCVRMCIFKLELCENADSHNSQENGFSPVCIRMCFFKLELCENANPHT